MCANKTLSFVLVVIFTFGPAAYVAMSQDGYVTPPNGDLPVVITIGRPNIWSLEQAHYLLARMHYRNRELEAQPLTGLNPNEVNATQMKLLRQVFGLAIDYAQTKTPKPKDDGSSEKESAENEATLDVNLPESVIKDFSKYISDPKLGASTELDNFIKLQYEIIAQQLTLLRDEVAPGERLVFLELPQSVYTTPKRGDKRLAQIWWRIEGFSRLREKVIARAKILRDIDTVSDALAEIRSTDYPTHQPKYAFQEVRQVGKPTSWKRGELEMRIRDLAAEVRNQEEILAKKVSKFSVLNVENGYYGNRYDDRTESRWSHQTNDKLNTTLDRLKGLKDLVMKLEYNLQLASDVDDPPCKPPQGIERNYENFPAPKAKELIESARLAKQSPSKAGGVSVGPDCTEFVPLSATTEPVRTVDLIPRQSSLIVNQTYDSVSGLNLWGGFSWLFGIGAKGNYQRQKENFQQFLNQEVYASGFGKGEADFGWTFGPLPGTKRLNPGLRTTYAVVIVPDNAETITLKGKGCFFNQKYNQPYDYQQTRNWSTENDDKFCGKEQEFTIPIPNGGDRQGFSIDQIRYLEGQEPGTRIVVSVKGQNFSPQIGVMVNGVTLCQSVGLAQPFLDKVNLNDKTCAEKDGISGQVEYVATDELVFVFKMPEDYKGTPTIEMIGPGRTAYLNKLPNVRVNSVLQRLMDAPYMIGTRLGSGLAIKDLKLFRTAKLDEMGALVIGQSFEKGAKIFVNGEVAVTDFLSPKQLSIKFKNQASPTLNITVVQDNPKTNEKDTDTASFSNVPAIAIEQVENVSYEPDKSDQPGFLIVKLRGEGLTGLIADIKGADSKSEIVELSPNVVILKIIKPEPVIQIALKNSLGQVARTVVIRPKS